MPAKRITKPTPAQIATLREQVHRAIDACFDAHQEMIFEAEGELLERGSSGSGRRSIGTHSDPTGERAIRRKPDGEWLKAFDEDAQRLVTRAAQTVTILGEPACPECGRPLAGRKSSRLEGNRFHTDTGCYTAARRKMKRREQDERLTRLGYFDTQAS